MTSDMGCKICDKATTPNKSFDAVMLTIPSAIFASFVLYDYTYNAHNG